MKRRVAIVSNLDPQCGNATYARRLQSALFDTYNVGMCASYAEANQFGPDVVIINWHPAKVWVDVGTVRALKESGKKVILMHQNSTDTLMSTGPDDILHAVDATVVHENVLCNADLREKIVTIPHGIIECELPPFDPTTPETIGTAGFPFPWKRPDVVVRTAKSLGMRAFVPLPPYPGWEWKQLQGELEAIHPGGVDFCTTWQSEEEIIWKLAQCTLNIFYFESKGAEDQLGQSGSVGLGLAAKRPMVVSRHRKLRGLLESPWADELYVCNDEGLVESWAGLIRTKVHKGRAVKAPDKLVKNRGWLTVAGHWVSLIEEVCA